MGPEPRGHHDRQLTRLAATDTEPVARGGRKCLGRAGPGHRGDRRRHIQLWQMTANGSTISSNVATFQGGGIANGLDTVTLNNSTVINNVAGQGNGIYTQGGAIILANSNVQP